MQKIGAVVAGFLVWWVAASLISRGIKFGESGAP
jgi:hypothetical protein